MSMQTCPRQWDDFPCPDAKTCAGNCVVEGVDQEYTNTYGAQASGNMNWNLSRRAHTEKTLDLEHKLLDERQLCLPFVSIEEQGMHIHG